MTQNSASAYSINAKYTVLSAAVGVTGQYGLTGLTGTAFVQLKDTYDANNVYLTAEKVRDFSGAALTPNEIATGGALNSLPAGALFDALVWLPDDAAARNAFNQLSGELHASVKSAMLDDSRFVRAAANDRLLDAMCVPGTESLAPGDAKKVATDADCPTERGTATWGRIFGSKGHIASDGNAAQLDHDIIGAFVGADTSMDNGWRVGGLIGYTRSTYDTDARGTASSDGYHIDVYGGNRWDNTSVRLGASYSWNKIDTQRKVSFAGFSNNLNASYDASTSQVLVKSASASTWVAWHSSRLPVWPMSA